jgi:hypothetical protein
MKDLKLTITIPGSDIQDIIEYARACDVEVSVKDIVNGYKEYFITEHWQNNLEDLKQYAQASLELE